MGSTWNVGNLRFAGVLKTLFLNYLNGIALFIKCFTLFIVYEKKGYDHQMANHQVTFDDRETGAHTKAIVSMGPCEA